MADYLTITEVLGMHHDQIEIHGGSHGVRDMGQLEAALFRPQSGYYSDIIEEAAALWESLSQNHPFIDGNKRVALNATHVFLLINNVQITAPSDQVWEFLSGLYETGTFTFSNLVSWLRENTQPV